MAIQQQLMESPPPSRSKKNTYRFPTEDSSQEIIISSNFDSGNVQLVRQINLLQYRLAAVPDDFKSNHKKCWFHFKVKPHTTPLTMRFTILNVSVLYPGYQNGVPPGCVYKHQQQDEWSRIPTMFMTHSEEPELIMEYQFKDPGFVYFALTVPFSYYDQIIYLQDLDSRLNNNQKVYYHRQVLTRSTLGFDVFVFTISHRDHTCPSELQEERFDSNLFPTNQSRAARINKPVVFINCRVHPGEVTSSHTLNGIIEFLIGDDIRAYILRKLFVFVIVPMANPDGVFQGNYRMDSTGTNLNRVYNIATATEYPEVFAIRRLAEYYHQDQRLQFFFDLHGHTSPKGAFIYGNALDDIVPQVESEIYCKLVEMNSQYFEFKDCCFSEKHMTMKDKNEPMSKEGCSRVVIGNITKLVHCLAMETGIYKIDPLRELDQIDNKEFQFNNMGIQQTDAKGFLSMFHSIGEAMMISLLDRIEKNPFSRLTNSSFKNLEELKRSTAFEILNNEDRFKKLDFKAYQKAKFITKYCDEVFSEKINKKLAFIDSDEDLQSIAWPSNFEGFKRRNTRQMPLKLPKTQNKSESRLSYPILPRKLLKSLSQGEKLEDTPSLNPNAQIQQLQQKITESKQTSIKIIERVEEIFSNKEGLMKLNKEKLSTRRLLKQFSNERVQSDRIQCERSTHQLRMASPINILSRGEIVPADGLKSRIYSKIQSKKSSSVLRKGLNRMRTDQIEEPPNLLVENDKIVPQQSQMLTVPKDRMLSITQPQNPMSEQQILQTKIRKIRNFKREILNVKFSDIRKRGSFKLPEIKKSLKKQQPLNLEELRKDIEIVKLISATNYNFTQLQLD